MLSTALALFAAGLLTILLPCIFPLIPIVLGVSVTDRNPLRPLVIIAGMLVSFVGFTFVLQVVLSQFVELADYIRLGTYYVLLLFGLGFAFHQRVILLIGAALGSLFFLDKGWIAVIIAAMLGMFAMEIGGRIASRLQQLGTDVQTKTRQGLGDKSLLTAFIVGLTLGLVWVPCAGPALGFALAVVRDQPGALAFFYLAAYGIGSAIPLLLIGYGGQAAVHFVRTLSPYTGYVKRAAGIILIVSSIAFHVGLFASFQAWFTEQTGYGSFGNTLEDQLFGGNEKNRAQPLVSGSKLPNLGKAPEEFLGAGAWHNSPPLSLKELRGKVVLIDFWTYSCINCIRTFPYLRGYWDTYKSSSFVLVGVHTPEFVFEKSEKNVSNALKKYDLQYPVVQDNDFGIWNSFQNRYWPAKYLIDAEGNIRYTHFGEGEYEETDQAIASLLKEMGQTADEKKAVPSEVAALRMPLTREIYVGPRSWDALGNRQGKPINTPVTYVAPQTMVIDNYYLSGTWQVAEEERQVLRSDDGVIAIKALAGEVNLVLGLEPGTEKAEAVVEVDGKEVSRFTIDHHDLYPLYNGSYGVHDVVLRLKGKGVEAYAYTFGG